MPGRHAHPALSQGAREWYAAGMGRLDRGGEDRAMKTFEVAVTNRAIRKLLAHGCRGGDAGADGRGQAGGGADVDGGDGCRVAGGGDECNVSAGGAEVAGAVAEGQGPVAGGDAEARGVGAGTRGHGERRSESGERKAGKPRR